MVVWSQLHGGGQVLARDDADLFHYGIGRLAEQFAHRSAVQGRGLMAVHRAGHFRAQPKLRN